MTDEIPMFSHKSVNSRHVCIQFTVIHLPILFVVLKIKCSSTPNIIKISIIFLERVFFFLNLNFKLTCIVVCSFQKLSLGTFFKIHTPNWHWQKFQNYLPSMLVYPMNSFILNINVMVCIGWYKSPFYYWCKVLIFWVLILGLMKDYFHLIFTCFVRLVIYVYTLMGDQLC